MIKKQLSAFVLLVTAACGGEPFATPMFAAAPDAGDAGGAGGAAGAAGAAGTTGAGGVAGAVEAGDDADAGACPDHMLDRGTYCIDDRPAIYVSGQQGAAVPWQNASDNCSIRGLRLCTEDERENSCGEVAYSSFCTGPANTWEWSATDCSAGRRLSPCCAVVQGYGACDPDETKPQSFHCCKDH